MDVNQPAAGVAITGPQAQQMLDISVVLTWGPAEVSQWLYKIGAEAAVPYFNNHCIQGRDLPGIQKDDLRYMQVPAGPLLRIAGQLEGLAMQKHQLDDKKTIGLRNKVLRSWNHYYGYCACMCCKTKRSYVLTGNSLSIIDTSPLCGGMHREYLDLSNVTDVDQILPGFTCSQICCGAYGYIDVTSKVDPKYRLAMKREDTSDLLKLITETWQLVQLQSTGQRA